MEEVAKELGFKEGEWEAWYKVSNRTVKERGGSRILSVYRNSLYDLLRAVFPDHPWDPMKFNRAPRKHWASVSNQRDQIISVGEKLHLPSPVVDPLPWYDISNQQFIDNGGGVLLAQNKGSLQKLLVKVFPEVAWIPWKFPNRDTPKSVTPSSPSSSSNSSVASTSTSSLSSAEKEELIRMVGEMEGVIRIESSRDWRRISRGILESFGYPMNLIRKRRKDGKSILVSALEAKYPEESWDHFLKVK